MELIKWSVIPKINYLEETNYSHRKEINSIVNKAWILVEWSNSPSAQKYEQFFSIISHPAFLLQQILSECWIDIDIHKYNADEEIIKRTLTKEQLKKYHKKKSEYEILQICDEQWNNLYYDNGMPVVDFRYRCHQKWNTKEVMNFHKWVSWILVNPKEETIFIAIKNKDNPLKWLYEIWWGHVWVKSFEEAVIDELWEEVRLRKWEYSTPREIHSTMLSDDYQNQFTKVYEVLVTSTEFVERKWDWESIWWKFYTKDQVIGFINWIVEIDWDPQTIEMIAHHRTSLLEYLLLKKHISQQTYQHLKSKIDKENFMRNKHIRVIRKISDLLAVVIK